MPNMKPDKTPMPHQPAQERRRIFKEVALGYTPEMAIEEASRCLNCKHKPCVNGCPVNVKIPEFIQYILQEDFEGAYQKICETNALPAVCGRVCPQETQCEAKCVRGIKGEPVAIGRLERFVADYHLQNVEDKIEKPQTNGIKVAVIGAGPAGLTCAGDLAKLGYEVTIFEAFHTAGGVLVYGIPEFRLPKEIVKKEIDKLEKLGVEIKTNMVIGKIFDIDELFEMGYKACFIGSGAGLPSFMGIEGEGLVGVFSANEYLTRTNLMKAYKEGYDTPIIKSKNVAVVGGGNVAMDAARCAVRLGAETVYIIYRRSEKELPARLEEIEHAKEEGVVFKTLHNPVKIIGDDNGRAKIVVCERMELGEPDESGRRSPVPTGEYTEIEADTVIMSIGTSPNPLVRSGAKDIQTTRRGCIVVNESDMQSSMPGVFAGGDAVTGAATVILAMGAGKQAAQGIHEYLSSNK
jgi:glutamate synthase (NADPH/NADH) small chain